jgi:hypothetical protein
MPPKPRRTKSTRRLSRVGLAHGNAWPKKEWYVPFQDGHAIIYHGHEDSDDHSLCGPQVFCCPKAATLLLQAYPETVPANADWEFTEPELLVSWMGPDGPAVFYFFFCDPDDRNAVCFSGVSAPHVRDVLFKRRPLDEYLAVAERIRRLEA